MNEIALLHALNILKRDGSTLYMAGNIGKDPALISGYVSAFSSMDREFTISNKNNNRHLISQFHRIGDVLMVIVGDNELITYGIFSDVEVAKIDELTNILSEIHEIFVKEIWSKLSTDQKDLGLLPQEIVEEFENRLFMFFSKKNFRSNVMLSPLFLRSEAGYYAVLWFLNRTFSKISRTLGLSAFWSLLHKIKTLRRLEIDPDLIIKVNEDKIDLVKPKDMDTENFIVFLSELIYETKVNIQFQLGHRILEELSIFGGIRHSI